MRINKFGALILATTFHRLMWDHSKQELLLGWSAPTAGALDTTPCSASTASSVASTLGSRASSSLAMLARRGRDPPPSPSFHHHNVCAARSTQRLLRHWPCRRNDLGSLAHQDALRPPLWLSRPDCSTSSRTQRVDSDSRPKAIVRRTLGCESSSHRPRTGSASKRELRLRCTSITSRQPTLRKQPTEEDTLITA